MANEFRLPDVGEGIAEAEIAKWLVHEGDSVKEDQELVEVETDKAIVKLPSPRHGTIAKLHGNEGDIIKVGQVLVSFADGEAPSAPPPRKEKKDMGTVVGTIGDAEEFELPPPIQAMPAVRARARELNVDLAQVRGTGPGGRITKEDVETAAAPAKPTEPKPVEKGEADSDTYGPVEKIPLRGLRRTIARRMQEARQRVPDVTIWEDADISDLEVVRTKEKKIAAERGIKLTYLPFVIRAALSALKSHPYLNCTLDDDSGQILLKKYYNIGIAVDTTDGLIVFTIKHADQKNILELAKEISALAEKARNRTLDISEVKGSTFTITNYGVIGASYGTPIINYPEVGILGIGKIEDRPVVKDGKIMIRKVMPLSLAFDHRVIDGVEAARFLNVVIDHLEDPNLMLIEGK
ncbi:MAG TPA: dihydrolipoamide acetyltransferase family protein [Candidatus Binatia bacterium]|jgi:pyruvate dehydrogenase E2 component (dihydrolipoamide acetyltransferase)